MVALQKKYAGKPLAILAFPCNQFASQEPHSNTVIEKFARGKGYSGPLFAKSIVNGVCEDSDCSPNSEKCCTANDQVWHFLTQESREVAGTVPWNFEKYLINKEGLAVKKWSAMYSPTSMEADIDNLLAH
eukprot:m.89691 g.89691  ORF g.89691 m.89691 type:complete len:130 (-) comp14981_c0_seq6:297-686(-)